MTLKIQTLTVFSAFLGLGFPMLAYGFEGTAVIDVDQKRTIDAAEDTLMEPFHDLEKTTISFVNGLRLQRERLGTYRANVNNVGRCARRAHPQVYNGKNCVHLEVKINVIN